MDSRLRMPRRTLGILVLAGVLALAVLVAAAYAATYQYCNGCTINSNQFRTSNIGEVSDLSYVHRLSGPTGSTVEIGALAIRYIAPYDYVCQNYSYAREVTCNPRNANVRGQAFNGGAGNYGFNAHLRY